MKINAAEKAVCNARFADAVAILGELPVTCAIDLFALNRFDRTDICIKLSRMSPHHFNLTVRKTQRGQFVTDTTTHRSATEALAKLTGPFYYRFQPERSYNRMGSELCKALNESRLG